jgi:hypothetical protein
MDAYFERNEISTAELAYAGMVAGLVAGFMVITLAMLMAIMIGEEAWSPFKMISVTVLDETWMDRQGFQVLAIVIGLGLHFGVATTLGIVFAVWGGRQDYIPAVGWGVVYGLAVWLVMQFIVFPVVNPVMAKVAYIPIALLHAIFGAALGSYVDFVPCALDKQAGEKAAA